MVNRAFLRITSFSPMKIQPFIRADQRRLASQFFVVKIFALHATRAAGRRDQFRLRHDLVQRRNLGEGKHTHVIY